MAKDIKALKLEQEALTKELSGCEDRIKSAKDGLESVRVEMDTLDKRQQELEAERRRLTGILSLETAERDRMLAKMDKLGKLLLQNMSGDELHALLVEVANEFLTNRTLAELTALSESLASFQPIGGSSQSLSEMPADDLPWATDDTESHGLITGFIRPSQPNDPSARCMWHENLESIGAKFATGKYMTIPLSDVDEVRAFFGRASRSLHNFYLALDANGVVYNMSHISEKLFNLSSFDFSAVTLERPRLLYTFALIEWLRSQGKSMDAETILKYLIGVRFFDNSGKILNCDHSCAIPYYRIEDKSGRIVCEVETRSAPGLTYTIYEDAEGYRIIAGGIGCATYAQMPAKVFPQYLGGNAARHRLECCANIEFKDIFKDYKLLVDRT